MSSLNELRFNGIGDLPSSFIKMEYHPRTGKPPHIIDLNAERTPQPPLPDEACDPWSPFPSIQDFIFAERVMQMGLSNSDIDFLLKNMHNGTFTDENHCRLHFKNADQMKKCVQGAASVYQSVNGHSNDIRSLISSQFKEKSFTYEFRGHDSKNRTLQYSVWVKNGMEALLELLRDPSLKDHWDFYAYKKYISLNGGDLEQVYDTPMSAEDAWDAEVCGLLASCQNLTKFAVYALTWVRRHSCPAYTLFG